MCRKARSSYAFRPLRSLFSRQMAMMLLLCSLGVDGQLSEKICAVNCTCLSNYHPADGPSVRVDCRFGGLRVMPVVCLGPRVNQLFITPPASEPNYLTIGPIFIQPVPYYDLRDLTITNSNVPSIGENSFWGLHKLRSLNLNGNNLKNISKDNFRGLINLFSLSLAYNQIEQMASETFRHLESLVELSLAHNSITVLVPRLFRMLGKLEFLDLSFNTLNELAPDVFKDIQNLVVFKCRKCSLRHINGQIYHIVPLIRELDLGDNLFKFLTAEDFSNLKRLNKLLFDRNELSVLIDNAFSGNSYLNHLDISHNRIALLAPGCFNNISNLSHLDISYNRLVKLNLQTFASHTRTLSSVNFSGNSLSLEEIGIILQILPHMDEVGLSRLYLKVIPPTLFMSNKYLRELDISSNLLTQFPSDLLKTTRYLQYLDISDNKLCTLGDLDLRRLEAIATINLSQNTWNCDQCVMRHILTYMNTSVLNESLRMLKCHSPTSLRGVYFGDLAKDLMAPCFTSYEMQKDIIKAMMLVLLTVLATAAIALYCTRRRGAHYYTDEEKRREDCRDNPELLLTTSSGTVSTIHSPHHHVETNS